MRALGLLGLLTLVVACAGETAEEEEEDVEAAESEVRFSTRIDPVRPPSDGDGCSESPLFRAIRRASTSTIGRGYVPASLYETSLNRADSDALITGREIFPTMAKLIAGAKREVAFMTFVWESDSDGAREILRGIKAIETRRKRAGEKGPPVMVRLLVDVQMPTQLNRMTDLAARLDDLDLDRAHVRYEVGMFLHAALGNLHAKTLVVDGARAVVTGANVEAIHDYEAPWFDTGYRLEGDVAISLLADFDRTWREGWRWTCGRSVSAREAFTLCREKPKDVNHFVDRAAIKRLGGACAPMLVTTRAADANPGSNRIDNTQDQAFLAAFAGAKRNISIRTPNLNDDAVKNALVRALRENPRVQVDLLLPKGFNEKTSSLPGQGGGNAANVAELYRRLRDAKVGDVCSRLRVRWHSRDGRTAIVGNGPHASHAKFASFDGQVAIVGSANMDTQAWNNSKETNVVVDDRATAAAWTKQVFGDWFERGIVVDECAR